jgi:hypothetical protein
LLGEHDLVRILGVPATCDKHNTQSEVDTVGRGDTDLGAQTLKAVAGWRMRPSITPLALHGHQDGSRANELAMAIGNASSVLLALRVQRRLFVLIDIIRTLLITTNTLIY